MTNDQLEAALRLADEAERVANAATPGPWTAALDLPTPLGDGDETHLWKDSLYLGEFNSGWQSREQRTANCKAAAHAFTSVPALASTVRGLVERVRELEGEASTNIVRLTAARCSYAIADGERDRLKAHCQLLVENAEDDIEERPRRHSVGSLIAVAKHALGITIRDGAYDPTEVYWWEKKKEVPNVG